VEKAARTCPHHKRHKAPSGNAGRGISALVSRSPIGRGPERMMWLPSPPANRLADRRVAGRHAARMVRGLRCELWPVKRRCAAGCQQQELFCVANRLPGQPVRTLTPPGLLPVEQMTPALVENDPLGQFRAIVVEHGRTGPFARAGAQHIGQGVTVIAPTVAAVRDEAYLCGILAHARIGKAQRAEKDQYCRPSWTVVRPSSCASGQLSHRSRSGRIGAASAGPINWISAPASASGCHGVTPGAHRAWRMPRRGCFRMLHYCPLRCTAAAPSIMISSPWPCGGR
jgi:hypothetical protein